MIIRTRTRARRHVVGIGDVTYIPPNAPPTITDENQRKVYDYFLKRGKTSIADAKSRFNTFRTNKEISADFDKSYVVAGLNVSVADSWAEAWFVPGSMSSERKAKARQILADLEETKSYWATQARTQPTAKSRPGARQQAHGVAPYEWASWALQDQIEKNARTSQVLEDVKNVPGDVLGWGMKQVRDALKKGLGIPDWAFTAAPYVALGIAGIIVYSLAKPYFTPRLPPKTEEASL